MISTKESKNKSEKTIGFMLRLFACIFAANWTIYMLIEKHNELVEVSLALPVLEKEVKKIEEENKRLKYEIERFESPIHLMELARKPQFSHLKFPYNRDILILPASPPIKQETPDGY
jgi:hypothetical protein